MVGTLTKSYFNRSSGHHFSSSARKYPRLSYHLQNTRFTRALISDNNNLKIDNCVETIVVQTQSSYPWQVILSRVSHVVVTQFIQNFGVHVDQRLLHFSFGSFFARS